LLEQNAQQKDKNACPTKASPGLYAIISITYDLAPLLLVLRDKDENMTFSITEYYSS
jgi:hypothetical protein